LQDWREQFFIPISTSTLTPTHDFIGTYWTYREKKTETNIIIYTVLFYSHF